MAETQKTRVSEEGNYGFMLAEYNPTEGTYGEVKKIEGLVSVDITFSQTTENKPADDVVDYLSRSSTVTGSGTITFMGLKRADYIAMYNKCQDDNKALVFGRKTAPKKVGISFFNTQNYSEGTSENKITINNVIFNLPPLSTQTVQQDDNTLRTFAVTVTANPIEYQTKGGAKDRVTFSILNSVDDDAIYEANKDKIYIPDTDAL